MIIKHISGATRLLAKDQEEYVTLPIRDGQTPCGQNIMTSSWEPTPDELAALNRGAAIHLSIMGTIHPPVVLNVVEDTDGN